MRYGTRMAVNGFRIAHGERSAQLVCHMGVLSGKHARNSIEAIAECFEANVARIEIDIHSLEGDDYAVYHDQRFENETTHTGAVGGATPDDVRTMRFLERPGRPHERRQPAPVELAGDGAAPGAERDRDRVLEAARDRHRARERPRGRLGEQQFELAGPLLWPKSQRELILGCKAGIPGGPGHLRNAHRHF